MQELDGRLMRTVRKQSECLKVSIFWLVYLISPIAPRTPFRVSYIFLWVYRYKLSYLCGFLLRNFDGLHQKPGLFVLLSVFLFDALPLLIESLFGEVSEFFVGLHYQLVGKIY